MGAKSCGLVAFEDTLSEFDTGRGIKNGCSQAHQHRGRRTVPSAQSWQGALRGAVNCPVPGAHHTVAVAAAVGH